MDGENLSGQGTVPSSSPSAVPAPNTGVPAGAPVGVPAGTGSVVRRDLPGSDQPAAVVAGQEVAAVSGSAGSARSGSGSSASNARKPQLTENVFYVRQGKRVLARVTQVNSMTNVHLDVEGQPALNVEHGLADGQWLYDGE